MPLEHRQALGGRPAEWVEFVNTPRAQAELDALCQTVDRGCPFGAADWQEATVGEPRLELTTRSPRRPCLRPAIQE